MIDLRVNLARICILDSRECGVNLNAFLIQTPANLKAHKFFAKIALLKFRFIRFKGSVKNAKISAIHIHRQSIYLVANYFWQWAYIVIFYRKSARYCKYADL